MKNGQPSSIIWSKQNKKCSRVLPWGLRREKTHPAQDSPSETTRVDNHFKNAMWSTAARMLMEKTVVRFSLHYNDGERESEREINISASVKIQACSCDNITPEMWPIEISALSNIFVKHLNLCSPKKQVFEYSNKPPKVGNVHKYIARHFPEFRAIFGTFGTHTKQSGLL